MADISESLLNLNKIETYYQAIFYKFPNKNKTIFVFNGKLLRKEDYCPLFVKYITKVIDYYYSKNPTKVTIVADFKDINKRAINIDFIIKFVKAIKSKYDGIIIMNKFYIINCPKSVKSIYGFIKPFLHSDTRDKMKLLRPEKSLSIENYLI